MVLNPNVEEAGTGGPLALDGHLVLLNPSSGFTEGSGLKTIRWAVTEDT